MWKVLSGPIVRLNDGPMKGTSAPHAPSATRRTPLTAPLVRGMRISNSSLQQKNPCKRPTRAMRPARPYAEFDMAVLIASDLRKDIAGAPLLKGVSLKLERRDRLTIAGRNGAGKTTLLRMLAGETSVDGGELVYSKGARVALHDQRPPRDRGLTLRDYVTAGAAHLIELESRLAQLEGRMAQGDTSERTLDAYGRAQGELEHHGGYAWRERA